MLLKLALFPAAILFSKKAQNEKFLITDIKSRETVNSFKDHEKTQENR